MLPSVEYLGYHIMGEWISPTKEKRRATVDTPVPKDILFWGLVSYYAKNLPCLADMLAPLCKQLTKYVVEQIMLLHSRRPAHLECFAGLL